MQIFWNRVLLLMIRLYEAANHQPISKNCCRFLGERHSSVSCCQWCCHPSTLYPGSNLSNQHDDINRMSNRRDSPNTHLVLLRLDLAEGCAKHAFPIVDDPIPIPLFCTSRLKVCEGRNPHHRQGVTLICAWRRHDRVIAPARSRQPFISEVISIQMFFYPQKMNFWQKTKAGFFQKHQSFAMLRPGNVCPTPWNCGPSSQALQEHFRLTSGSGWDDMKVVYKWE